MNTLSATGSLLTHSLIWALLYSLWQGLLIYGILYALLKALPNMNARVKYYLSFGGFSALFLWFANTWAEQYERLKGITVYITQAGADGSDGTVLPVRTFADTQAGTASLQHMLHSMEQYFPFVIILYTTGLAFMLFRFAVNVIQVKALSNKGIAAADPRWNDFISLWRNKLGILQPVKLFLSYRVNVPMMIGTLKPVILLPIATINHLTTEQVEAILLHELAHIKRKDYLLNIIQTIIETILFFNPFVWLLSGIIRREREHCCDDIVVGRAASPLPYAKALAMLESYRIKNNDLALAATGHNNELLHRIKRIMEMKKKNLNYSQLTIIIAALMAITFTIAMFTFTPSFAQKGKGSKSDSTRKNVYHYRTVKIDSNGKKTVVDEESAKPKKHKISEHEEDDDNMPPNSKTRSYSYSYSSDDGDDLNKVIKEITIATKGVLDAVGDIDMTEIEREIEKANKDINSVDWDEIKDEINKGIAEVDKELNNAKLNKEISAEVRKALEKSRDAMVKAKEQIKHVPQVPPMPPVPPSPGGSGSAFVSVGGGSGNKIESMLNKMEKDGLIDRSKNYKVEKENDELYINGQKQPESIYNKYSKYLKDKTVTIKGKKGNLTIMVDN